VKARTTPKTMQQCTAETSTYLTKMTGKWVLLYGSGTLGVRIMDELRQPTANWAQKSGYRTAAVSPDFPNAWVLASTPRTNVGCTPEDFTPAAGAMWIQACLAGAATSGTAEALSGLQMSVKSAGEIVATGQVQLEPDLNSTQTAYFPIGDPIPAAGLSGMMFAVVSSGVNGTTTFQAATRTMDRADEPGVWTDQGSANTITQNDRWNSGDISITASTMLIQPGIKVTTASRALLQVLVAGRF
jgi:hypothetical protein